MYLYVHERRDEMLREETASAGINPSIRAMYGLPAAFLGECDSLVAAEGSIISFLVYNSPMQYSLLERPQEHNPVLTFASAAFIDVCLVGATWQASDLVGHLPGDTLPGHSNKTY